MSATWEFRIVEEFADLLFASTEGTRLGDNLVRLVEVSTDDPRFKEIGRLQKQLDSEKGESFFTSWRLKRSYSKKELELAELFRSNIRAIFEPAGEECGTVYDESKGCLHCGAGREQVSDLRLNLWKVPNKKDIAATIADEWIISQSLAFLLVAEDITGFALRPVRHISRAHDEPLNLESVPTGRRLLQLAKEFAVPHPTPAFWMWLNKPEQRELLDAAFREREILLAKNKNGRVPPIYYQLIVTSSPLRIVFPTRVGIDPFDDDSEQEYVCPLGHVIGLNLLSDAYVDRASYDGSDFACTREMVGIRSGLLRPAPLLMISPRLRRLLKNERIKGFETDIAHLSE